MESLTPQLNIWRFQGHQIIFTNGCFDILHSGHLHILTESKNLHGKFIIGLNSDVSVKKIKGTARPINNEETRATLLAAFTFVDAVILFQEETPLKLVSAIKPDILTKGGDWNENEIVGSDLVLNNGGRIEVINFLEGNSTSLIERRIKENPQ